MSSVTEVARLQQPATFAQDSSTDYILAAEMFREGYKTEIDQFFTNLNKKFDFNVLARSIQVLGTGTSGEVVTSLRIDFFDNRIVTWFQGEEKTVDLFHVLEIFRAFSGVFSTVAVSRKEACKERRYLLTDSEGVYIPSCYKITFEEAFTQALATATRDEPIPNMRLEWEGKRIMTFEKQKVFVGNREMSIECIQRCSHLFHQHFAKEICASLDIYPNLINIFVAIRELVIGRCVLGIAKSMVEQQFKEDFYERRLTNIRKVIANSKYLFFGKPIL